MKTLSIALAAALLSTAAFAEDAAEMNAINPHATVEKAAHAEAGKIYTEVSADEVKQMIDNKEKVVLIDANGASTYKKGHLEGAVNLTPKQITADSLAKVAPSKDTTLVFYCGGFSCPSSAKAAKAAHEAGYTNLKKFPGGLEEWEQKGYPLIKG